MDYREKVSSVYQQIASSCERSGRQPDEIIVIGVTKYVGIEETRALIAAGIQHLGENRVQSAVAKVQEISEQVHWHFIGSLQTNKVKDVMPYFQWFHSLDRISLAKEMQKQAEKLDNEVSCLVQVNVSGELSKSGCALEEVAVFLKELTAFDRVKARGFMTMAPLVQDAEAVRPVFRQLRELRGSFLDKYPDLLHLSMGMSGDFKVAVEEGATMVRLGTVLVKP